MTPQTLCLTHKWQVYTVGYGYLLMWWHLDNQFTHRHAQQHMHTLFPLFLHFSFLRKAEMWKGAIKIPWTNIPGNVFSELGSLVCNCVCNVCVCFHAWQCARRLGGKQKGWNKEPQIQKTKKRRNKWKTKCGCENREERVKSSEREEENKRKSVNLQQQQDAAAVPSQQCWNRFPILLSVSAVWL